MDQMKMLVEFQAADTKAESTEKSLRNSKLRRDLENARKGYTERQTQYKQIEEQMAQLSDRKDILSDALDLSKKQLENLQSRYENNPPESIEGVRALLNDVNRCLETIKGYEAELRQIHATVREAGPRIKKLREEGSDFRKTFESLKPQYDAEAARLKKEYQEHRSKANQLMKAIDESLLAKYNEIKIRVNPPIARVYADQCSGCNTSLSSTIKSRLRNASGEIVECQNCGRMLYLGS